MKYLSKLIIVLSFLGLFSAVHADFFEKSVLGTTVESTFIDQIVLTKYTFGNVAENTRYANAFQFVTAVKNEAKNRFAEGIIPFYRQYDIIQDLDALVHSLNEYFYFKKQYEQTGVTYYKDAATDYLADARGDYERLSSTLKQSAE